MPRLVNTVCAELAVRVEMDVAVKSTPAPGVVPAGAVPVNEVPVVDRSLLAAVGPEMVNAPVLLLYAAVTEAALYVVSALIWVASADSDVPEATVML